MGSEIAAIYCDGGVIAKNPSPYGGTWAWVAVDAAGELVRQDSGTIDARGITNNVTEFVAAIYALEAVPQGWSGTLYSDSQVTLGRLFHGWALGGLGVRLINRGSAVLKRLGKVEPVLLQGHPTKADLEAGIDKKRGLPVSRFNQLCDQECQRLARRYLQQLGLNEGG
jgi:ribonuclease HI